VRIAEIVDGVVVRVTIANDEDHGAVWLTKNVGGVWVACAVEVNIGWLFDGESFAEPPLNEPVEA